MEKPFKIVISVVAVMLYSLTAVGFFVNQEYRNVNTPVAENSEAGTFFAEELPFINGFAVNDANGTYFNARVISGSSNQLQAFRAVIHILEVQVACAFSISISRVHFFPVRIRKSDMLFPFHYFFESILT